MTQSKQHQLLGMTLLLGHGTPIQAIETVKGFPRKDWLMIAEVERSFRARLREKNLHNLGELKSGSQVSQQQFVLMRAIWPRLRRRERNSKPLVELQQS